MRRMLAGIFLSCKQRGDRRAKSAGFRAFFRRHQELLFRRQAADQFLVQRLHEARIDHGGVYAQGLQPCCRFHAGIDHGAERQDADVGALAQNLAFADLRAPSIPCPWVTPKPLPRGKRTAAGPLTLIEV